MKRPREDSERERLEREVTIEDARQGWKDICNMFAGHLLVDNKVTPVPYLGIGTPPLRPPVKLNFVGNINVMRLLIVFQNTRRVVVHGHRGIGKSSDFRALAALVYKTNCEKKLRRKLVSFWNMRSVLENVVAAVRDALLFTYLMPNSDNESSQRALEDQILRIRSVDDAIEFIRLRKASHGEFFYFMVDGWDEVEQPVYAELERLFIEGKGTWYCASAKENIVSCSRKVVYACAKTEPFNEIQYAAYATHSKILARLGSTRGDEIVKYTGMVPMFLDALRECCLEFGSRLVSRVSLVRHFGCMRELDVDAVEPMIAADDEEIVKLLTDDDNWQSVLELFKEHTDVYEVHEHARRVVLDEPCYTMEAMGLKDATYFNSETSSYCSEYVHRVYVEEFRRKEAQIQSHAGGAWLPYCKHLVEDGRSINWSGVEGWIVEGLLADVLTNRKVYLGQHFEALEGLKLETFTGIKPVVYLDNVRTYKPGTAVYCKPDLYSFPFVDGIIIYVDMRGTVHIIGLQVTVDVDDHQGSALQFMSFQYLKMWFPDLDVRGHQDDVQLHFIYVGCSKKHKDECSKDQAEQVTKLRTGKPCGIARHKWSFIPLVKAFGSLNSEEFRVVEAVVKARKLRSSELDLSAAALMQINRPELDGVARTYGLNPSDYSSKVKLVNELGKLMSLDKGCRV